jgi:hypothetical protein
MLTTDERTAAPPATADEGWIQGRISSQAVAVVGSAFFVLTMIGGALEPATSEPVPLLGVVLSIGFFALLAVMITGLAMSRRFGLVAAVGAAALFTASSVACPASGHHAYGWWWAGQMACALALLGISWTALRRS